MKIELNNLDLVVKQMMLGYPSIFPSRLECLCHLFATTGTGYEWNDEGQLEKSIYMGEEDVELTKIKMPIPPDDAERHYAFNVVNYNRKKMIRQFTEDNIDFLAADYHHTGSRYSILNVYPMYKPNMEKVLEAPELIDRAFLSGISELSSWILHTTRSNFLHYEKDEDVNLPEVISSERCLSNYIIAGKVYKACQKEFEKRNKVS